MSTLLVDVDHSSTSTSKYNPLADYLAELVGLPAAAVYVAYLSKPGNVTVRMEQSQRVKRARLKIGVVAESSQLVQDRSIVLNMARKTEDDSSYLLISPDDDAGAWRLSWGLQPEGGSLLDPLRSLVPSLEIGRYLPLSPSVPKQVTSRAQRNALPSIVPLAIDNRIRRMLRAAVASRRAVMLVGPPGTGKTTFVQQMCRELVDDPTLYGMTRPHDVLTVTADESWTTRELVGGDSIDEQGRLRFASGYVLQAIKDDKWLLIDEANRADLDRIFGGLLTWLSGQEVTVGRLSPTKPAEVVLGWSTSPDSSAPESLDIDDHDADDRLLFTAGTEWRLIGTYNSVDAHRVFRLGLALGRRFAQVPVPPPGVAEFRRVLDLSVDQTWETEERKVLLDAVSAIYAAHAQSDGAALGPAPFLTIPPYVRASVDDPGHEVRELIAEAYLSAFGTWLARQDESFLDKIGSALRSESVLGSQWDWVRMHLASLA